MCTYAVAPNALLEPNKTGYGAAPLEGKNENDKEPPKLEPKVSTSTPQRESVPELCKAIGEKLQADLRALPKFASASAGQIDPAKVDPEDLKVFATKYEREVVEVLKGVEYSVASLDEEEMITWLAAVVYPTRSKPTTAPAALHGSHVPLAAHHRHLSHLPGDRFEKNDSKEIRGPAAYATKVFSCHVKYPPKLFGFYERAIDEQRKFVVPEEVGADGSLRAALDSFEPA